MDVETQQLLLKQEKDDVLLTDNPTRWVIFPLKHMNIWDLYKRHQCNFWTCETIDFQDCYKHKKELPKNFSNAVESILAFFSICDGYLIEDACVTVCLFLERIQVPEARSFYSFQCAWEMIHRETWNHFFKASVPDAEHRDTLRNEVMRMQVIQAKVDWLKTYYDKNLPFAILLIVHAIHKILFTASIRLLSGYFKMKNFHFPSFIELVRLVNRDFQLHEEFSAELYKMLKHKLTLKDLRNLLDAALLLEVRFATAILPLADMELTEESLLQFYKSEADSIMYHCNGTTMYNVVNPFSWSVRTPETRDQENFCTVNTSVETRATVDSSKSVFSLDADF